MNKIDSVRKHNEARSRNYCYHGEPVGIACSECGCSLSCPKCKVHALYYIVICVLSGGTIFFYIIPINGTIFRKELLHIKCVLFFSITFIGNNLL